MVAKCCYQINAERAEPLNSEDVFKERISIKFCSRKSVRGD